MPSSEVKSYPYLDEFGRTDAETYLMGVLDGSIVAGQKMIMLAEKMLPRIRNGYKKWSYSVDAALKIVKFIEQFCFIPSGKMNVPFILEPYERMIVELIFGFVDENNVRMVQYGFIEIARKNGKTSLGAAIELYMLLADGEFAPQIYCAASSKQQASIAYSHAWKMVRQSPKLQKYLKKGIVMDRKETGIICDKNMGFIIPLSKQSDYLDGLDVAMALLDELASWKDRSVFDLIRQGTSARRSPLIISISTNGFVREGIFDRELEQANKWLKGEIEDDRFLPILFEQDSRDEIWSNDIELYRKSNPGLGTVKSIETLKSNVLKGVNDPSFVNTLLIKDFNWPASQATAYLTYEEACPSATYEFDRSKFKYCYIGMDAADSLDLNSATALFMTPGDDHIYRRSMYWIAEEQVKINSNNQRGRDGGVPYQEYAARGILRIVPGNFVPRRVFLEWVQELYSEGLFCVGIGFDRWGFKEIRDELEQLVGADNVVPIPMGAQTLSTPMKQLKSDMRVGRIIDNNNSLDHLCNLNVTAITDLNDNVRPVKRSGPTTRIDGFIALLCAYKMLTDRIEVYRTMIGG